MELMLRNKFVNIDGKYLETLGLGRWQKRWVIKIRLDLRKMGYTYRSYM
jgi:hypothetical protein